MFTVVLGFCEALVAFRGKAFKTPLDAIDLFLNIGLLTENLPQSFLPVSLNIGLRPIAVRPSLIHSLLLLHEPGLLLRKDRFPSASRP